MTNSHVFIGRLKLPITWYARCAFGLQHKQFQRWTKHEDISQKSYFEANDTKSNILWDSLQQNAGGLYAKLVDRALFFWVY